MLNNSLIAIIWRILNLFLGAIFRVILVKTLGINVAGKIDYIISISTTLLTFFLFGFNLYLSKNLVDNNEEKQYYLFSNSIFVSLILFLSSSILLVPLFMYWKFSIRDLFCILFTTISFLLSELIYYYYIGIKKSNKANFYNFLMALLHALIYYLTFIFYKSDIFMYFLSLFLSYTLIQVFILKDIIIYRKPNFSILKQSFSLYFPSLIYGLFPSLARVLHKKLSNESSLFIFSTSIAFLNLLNIVPIVLSNSYSPVFSQLLREDNNIILVYEVKRIIRISFLMIIPVLIFIFLNSRSILSLLLLNKDIENSILILRLISIVGIFRIFSFLAGSILNMSGNEKIEIFNSMLKVLLLIFLTKFSSLLYLGVVILYVISEGIISFIKLIQIKRIFKFYMLDLKNTLYFLSISLLNFLIIKNIGTLEGLKLIYIGIAVISINVFFNILISPFKDYIILKESCNFFLNKIKIN